MTRFVLRLLGAAALRRATFEDVEADTTATAPAMAVVLLASVAAGVGDMGGVSIAGVLTRSAVALASWVAWAVIIREVGGRILPEPQTRVHTGELLRTLGFAAAPGVFRVFGVVPQLGRAASFVASVWMLAAMVVAVRQALDYRDTWRAVLVCIVGGAVALGVTIALGLLTSTPVS